MDNPSDLTQGSQSSQDLPTINPQDASVPVADHTDTRKKTRRIGIIIVLFVLVLVAAALLWNQQRNLGNPDQSTKLMTPKATPTAIPTNKGKQPEITLPPKAITPVPSSAPKSENEFYRQVGTTFKEVLK